MVKSMGLNQPQRGLRWYLRPATRGVATAMPKAAPGLHTSNMLYFEWDDDE